MREKLAKACEIKELLNLRSDARVYELARRGILPGVVHVGRHVRFDMAEVLKFIEQGGRRLRGGWRLVQPERPPDELRINEGGVR